MLKKVMHGELGKEEGKKRPNDKLAINANMKVRQGDLAGDKNDARGASKSKVDPSIFRMAEERDY